MRVTTLNFSSATPPLSGWRLVLLVISIIAVTASSVRWAMQINTNAALETQLSQIQPSSTSESAAVPATPSHEIDTQILAASEAVKQLNLPIGQLINALPIPRDIRVSLLSVEVNHARGGTPGLLKITAEAKSAHDMTAYAAFVNDQPVFQSAYLVKHELNPTSSEQPVRFFLEAQWRE